MRTREKPPDRCRRRWLLLTLLLALAILPVAGAFATPPSSPPPPPRGGKGGRRGGGGGRRKGPKGEGGGKEKGKEGQQQQQQQQQQQEAPRMKPRFMPVTQARDAREAAYLAALAAERDQGFISDTLQEWARTKKPSGSEMGLATLVASVACREAGSLDYAIRALAGDGPVRLKGRQRVVLRTALAQYKYCTHTPLYAIVDHAVGLAKRYGGGGGAFAGFTNALLRKLPPDAEEEEKGEEEREGGKKAARTRPLPLPEGDSVEAMAAALSFPPFLVRLFVEDFGLAGARRVMEASNTFPPTMARARAKDAAVPSLQDDDDDDSAAAATTPSTDGGGDDEGLLEPEPEAPSASASPSSSPQQQQQLFEPVAPADLPRALARAAPSPLPLPLPYPLGVVRSKQLLRRLTRDPRWYVTNGTPAGLIGRLAEGAVGRILGGGKGQEPLRVLDVCAAPGGKGLAVWDVVREGQGHPVRLVMNDVSEEKTARIRENLAKFGLLIPDGDNDGDQGDAAVRISIGDGTALALEDQADPGYDVVIVDAPCSNAGVLGRRPEARWRLGDGALLAELEGTQLALLRNARRLLSRAHAGAEIWYMTCSILRREDEGLVARACAELGLEVVDPALEMKVLPGEGGLGGAFDGGYGVALRRTKA